MRRVPRIALTGAAVALAVVGLTGCRTSPNVAAYVGDETITVDELNAAVDARLRDDTVASFAAKDQAAFTRQVLSGLVLREVYAAAVEHYGVDRVTDAEALDYLSSLVGGAGAEQEFAADAKMGYTRADVIQAVRQQVIQAEVAEATGKSDRPSESDLRAQYDQNPGQFTVYELGYIGVPDQNTANAVLAQVEAQPQTYPAVASNFSGPATLPELTSYAVSEIPLFADQVQATGPGSGFTTPVQQLGAIEVCYVASVTPATFQQARAQLVLAAQRKAADAGQQVVADFRKSLDVTVNPRYGTLTDKGIVPETDGVVHVLGGASSTASPSGTTGG